MSKLNPVSTNIRFGSTGGPMPKKIYQGSDTVYENAHEDIDGNQIAYPFFNGDSKYPGSFRFGAQEGWSAWHDDNDRQFTDGWGFHSNLFVNQGDFKCYLPNYFLFRFETKDPVGYPTYTSQYRNHEHVDIARIVQSRYSSSASGDLRYTLYGGGATGNRKRILKLHGSGSRLISFNADPDRKYPAIPITTCTTTDHPTIDDTISWGGDTDKRWCCHQYMTEVAIPANATSMTFGAYVRCESGDHFKDRNGAVISAILPEFGEENQYGYGITCQSGSTLTFSVDASSITGDPRMVINMFNPNNHAEYWASSEIKDIQTGSTNTITFGPFGAEVFLRATILLDSSDAVTTTTFSVNDDASNNNDINLTDTITFDHGEDILDASNNTPSELSFFGVGASNICHSRVHNIVFRKEASASIFNLKTGTITGDQAQFQWSGPSTKTDKNNGRGIHRWNDEVIISDIQYEDSEDYHDFKKVSRTVTNASGDSLRNPHDTSSNNARMILCLGFLESHSYLAQYGNSGATGGVQYYNPFVTFTTS